MEMTRRQALARGTALGATALGLSSGPASWAAKRIRPEALLRGGSFPLGVAAGQPTPSGAILWTRVDEVERSGRVTLEIARDADFRQVVRRTTTRAASVRDFCTRAKVTGLPAGEQFFYRFATRDADSPVGRFRTALPPDSREPVRIGFFSCQKWSSGYYAAHRGLAAEPDLDVVVSLGDYVYEGRDAEPDVPGRPDRTGANRDAEVHTLPEWQEKYRLYRSDRDLQAMHAAHPYVAVWDDHEVENDYAGDEAGTASRRPVPFLERRRAGYEAFFQYHPVARDAEDRSRIFRSVALGANADLVLLDTRRFRDPLACEPESPCPEGSAPGRSILGAAQRAWLLDALGSSRAAWKVLGNQVMMAGLDLPTGVQFNADQWDGYADERRVIGTELLRRGVRDVTVLTGDIHSFFASTVTTDGRITGTPWATEFVGGSITSSTVADALAQVGQTPLPEPVLQGLNPHMRYTNLRRNGYGVVECRPDELRVDFKAVSDRTKPDATTATLASFRVARGSTEIERV